MGNGGWRRDNGREESRGRGSDAALCVVNQPSIVMF
jgi:hypothetical protein